MIFCAIKPNTPNNRGRAGLDKTILRGGIWWLSGALRGDKMRAQK